MNQINRESILRRQYVEQLLQSAYLRQEIYHHADPVKIYWPDDLGHSGEITVRLQTPAGRIYAEAHPTVQAGSVISLGSVYQVPDGVYHVMLLPSLEEYYVHGLHIERPLSIQITNAPYATTPYGTYGERRLEALADAMRRNLNIFSEIARLELGRGATVDWTVIEVCIATLNHHGDSDAPSLLGLLGLLMRYQEDVAFPPAIKSSLTTCIPTFKQWIIEPSDNALGIGAESYSILWPVCEILAGQLCPNAIFSATGQTGAWHQANGEQLALVWLGQRAATGFSDWDSSLGSEEIVLALTHLVDLAVNGEVAEMAAVLLDKLFFSLAVNAYQGVFGATQGRADSLAIKSGRLSATAGVTRLLWGIGAFNEHMLGTVSLACAHGYELPPLIAEIAADLPEEMWNCERHTNPLAPASEDATAVWAVNKVTYKTPDYLLGSAQDYRPGAPGAQEQIWQAILGPDAVVFVNHPFSLDESANPQSDFWCGNRVLSRVAQWKDSLIAIHKGSEADPVGFTHAYFPTAAFDEYLLKDGWAFARKGNGYLALTAAGGLALTTTGTSAYRELRSYGQHMLWFCQLGRAALDGSFSDFQTKILALNVGFEPLAVQVTTIRGQTIGFGWTGPLIINGHEQALHQSNHYDNPYCVADLPAAQMEIQFQDQLMRLDFSVPT